MHHRIRRFTCSYPIRIGGPHGECDAVIRNIHTHGAKLTGAHELQAGDRCTLMIAGARVVGDVRWATPSAIGVAFATPLTERQVQVVGRLTFAQQKSKAPAHQQRSFTPMR